MSLSGSVGWNTEMCGSGVNGDIVVGQTNAYINFSIPGATPVQFSWEVWGGAEF